MSSHPLSGDYLHWLASQIQGENDGRRNPSRTYEGLVTVLAEKEFVWLVPHDDNRVMDGLGLREEYCRERGISTLGLANAGPASFLEVLVGLSRRLAFAAGGDAPGWAWTLVRNLGLDKMYDTIGPRKYDKLHGILDSCIFRTYSPDGQGGFFPLRWSEEDQTKVEIWYQMAAYIAELDRR